MGTSVGTRGATRTSMLKGTCTLTVYEMIL